MVKGAAPGLLYQPSHTWTAGVTMKLCRTSPPPHSNGASSFQEMLDLMALPDPRGETRARCRGQVFIRPIVLCPGPASTAAVVDVSPGGLGMLLAEPIGPGRMLSVHLPRASAGVPQPLLVKTTYIRRRRDGLFGVGGAWSHPLAPAQFVACLQAFQSCSTK